MTETSPLSSSPLALKNVTVNPNVFELKKCYRFCGSPSSCSNSHHDIIFGDLAYFKCVSEANCSRYSFPPPYRDFSRGNYSISVVNFSQEEANPMVIFHLENFDPSLLATALLGGEDKNEGCKNEVSAVEKRWYVLGAMDCICTRSINSRSHKKTINKHQTAIDDNCAQPTSELASGLNLVWKSDPTDVESSDFLAPHLDGLIYFVNAAAWFEYCNFPDPNRSYSDADAVEISALTAGIYQLRANNETIGVAVNPSDVFGDAEVYSAVVKDLSANCVAVVLHGFAEDGNRNFAKFVLPEGLFLYESVYRSFYEFRKEIENPYYGYDEDNEFARLPDIIFIKILSYLPWRQRIQFGRVSKRWRAVSNSATAIDTRVIDLSNERYKRMRSHNLNVILPIVSNHLEEIIWSSDKPWSNDTTNFFKFEDIGQVQLFPKLRKIYISQRIHYFDGFFSLLNKCPNLKELTAPIARRPSSNSFSPCPYIAVEKLGLINLGTLTDPLLIEIIDYFPKLISLHIYRYDFLSSSCISAVAEKCGETLARLEIDGPDVIPIAASSMIGAITGFGSCPYLEYLSLVRTDFISDPCMAAIAAGCPKLTTLDISGSNTVTNEGLATLVSLTNLKRLDVSNVGSAGDLSFGIAQLAKAGHLEQLLVKNAPYLSAACLKLCVRYCRQLKLVDISGSTAGLTADDATEIVHLYGTWGLQSRLIIRSGNKTWLEQAVRIAKNEVTETFNRRFLVGHPDRLSTKWAPEDDSDSDSDYDDGDEDDYDYFYDYDYAHFYAYD